MPPPPPRPLSLLNLQRAPATSATPFLQIDPHPTAGKTAFENTADFLLNLLGVRNALFEPGRPTLGGLLGSVLPFVPGKGAAVVRAGKNLGRIGTAGRIAEGGRDITPLLERMGYLGFDTAAQAKQAILVHPDWAQRWPVDSPEVEEAIHSWKALVKAKKTPQLTERDLDEIEEILGPAGFPQESPVRIDWGRAPDLTPEPPPPPPPRAPLRLVPRS